MADFPTLTVKAQACPDEPIDDTLSSKSEGGYTNTRPRNTRQRRKFGPVKMILIEADWQALKTFDSQVGGWSIFNWTHPTTGTVHQVRFTARPKTDAIRIKNGFMYPVEFTLETA
jgi:phage-related protein